MGPSWTRLAAAAAVAALAACSGGGGEEPPRPTGAVVSVAVVPAAVSLPIDRAVQLAAVATLDDGRRVVMTTEATWASTDPSAVATVVAGKVTPVPGAGAGATSTITAAYGGKSGSGSVTLAGVPPAIGPGVDVDPLIAEQWHLANVGQFAYAMNPAVAGYDVDAALTYAAGIAGRGVKVAVLDSGLEIAHEDLAANLAPGSWNFSDGTTDPTSPETFGDHGTSVAGLIAAVRGNAKGGMGVAPAARLNGYNVLVGANQTVASFVASLGAGNGGAGPKSSDVWVFNQSFGVSTAEPLPMLDVIERQYLDGVSRLRGGLGAVYVKSAGNGFLDVALWCWAGLSCENASMDPANTLPMNVVVGAVNAAGKRASYSTAGSALWISGFGGENGFDATMSCDGVACTPACLYDPAMITVDQSGCASGYARSGVPSSAFNRGAAPNGSCNYTNGFNGTSSAAPVVSGVVALMLEANPALTWRDVKHILATTARQIDVGIAPVVLPLPGGNYIAEPGWTTNAAGHAFHDWYGFGLVDADLAVAAALAYEPGRLGTFRNTGWVAGTAPAAAIPDENAAGVSGTASIARALAVEAVQIRVSTNHTFLGDLGIELRSPSGTRSVLLNAANAFGSSFGKTEIRLASNAFYGETGAGTWTLKVVDALEQDVGRVLGWSIRIYGH
jgi:subtilisin family serine protease